MPAEAPLYALTIWPEWVYAMLELGKDVELRPWPLPKSFIGRTIVLHAGAYVGGSGPKSEGRANVRHFIERVRAVTGAMPPVGWTAQANLLRRRLAAVATLGAPALLHPSPWSDPDGDVWSIPVANLRRIPLDVQLPGGRRFWCVPPELAAEIRSTMSL